jgi:hypothetical protein
MRRILHGRFVNILEAALARWEPCRAASLY